MRILPILSLGLLAYSAAGAAVITGELWDVPDAVAGNAVPSNVPSTAANVTFQVNSQFDFTDAGTVDQWLLSGGAYNITGSAADLSRAISPSLIELTGQVTVIDGQQFTTTHDDGLTLTIGSDVVISSPGATAPVQTTGTYSGVSGTLPFSLVYGECCGGSAVLEADLPLVTTATPEPSSYATAGLGVALLVLSFVRRSSFRKK